MNEEIEKENPLAADKNSHLTEIDRRSLEGHSSVQISELLAPKPLNIARNLSAM